MNADATKILYVGKSKDLKGRLQQHLEKCSISTGSHIEDVINYLIEHSKFSKELLLKYCVINTKSNKHNATIEGALLDYVMECNDVKFNDCWNKRMD